MGLRPHLARDHPMNIQLLRDLAFDMELITLMAGVAAVTFAALATARFILRATWRGITYRRRDRRR